MAHNITKTHFYKNPSTKGGGGVENHPNREKANYL
jgi:hypothetical protein